MALQAVNATLYRDTHNYVRVTVVDGSGAIYPVVGHSVSYRIGDAFTKANMVTVPGTVYDTDAGEVQAELDDDTLDALTKNLYAHQFVLTDLSTNVAVSVDGYLTIRRTIPAS